MTYLVIAVTHANRYGVDYASPFLDNWQDTIDCVETTLARHGDNTRVMVIHDPFTDSAFTATYTRADFEEEQKERN